MTSLYIFAGIGVFWSVLSVGAVVVITCAMFSDPKVDERLSAIDEELSHREYSAAQVRYGRRA